jgi:hypothetical protein
MTLSTRLISKSTLAVLFAMSCTQACANPNPNPNEAVDPLLASAIQKLESLNHFVPESFDIDMKDASKSQQSIQTSATFAGWNGSKPTYIVQMKDSPRKGEPKEMNMQMSMVTGMLSGAAAFKRAGTAPCTSVSGSCIRFVYDGKMNAKGKKIDGTLDVFIDEAAGRVHQITADVKPGMGVKKLLMELRFSEDSKGNWLPSSMRTEMNGSMLFKSFDTQTKMTYKSWLPAKVS